MKNFKYYLVAILVAIILVGSCKKKFENPKLKEPLTVSDYITIDSLFKKHKSYYKGNTKPDKFFKFQNDVNLECIVSADETSGNIYKTIFVEDATGAIQIKLMNKSGLFVGDKIRINLNGIILNDYGGVVQLDSIDSDKRMHKMSSGNKVVPIKLTFNQFLLLNMNGQSSYQSRLILIDSVEFSAGSKNQLFADPVGKNSIDRTLLDAYGGQVIVRTSAYANFSGSITPCGRGSLIAIVSQYNSTVQLIIRDFKEIKMTNSGCPLLIKSFDDQNIESGGWLNYKISGSIDWKTGIYNGQTYAQISNYLGGGNKACETWLISPALDISSAPNPRFSFRSAFNYTGPTLQVLISTNYYSGDPKAATWVTLNPTLSGGSWNWIQSGVISLIPYKSSNTRVAFKYTGTSSAGSTWELDDVAVFGE